jgi:hypothetical protein
MHSEILFGFMILKFSGLANIWNEKFSRILCFGSTLGGIITKNCTVLSQLHILHIHSLSAVSGLMPIIALMTVAFALENNLQKLWCVL